MEDWVPPLEVLEEMRKDEPNRFLSWTGTHESACMALYDQGKTREEVFREVSSRPSGAEYNSALEEERQRENERLSSSLGLFPGLEGRDVNQKQSAGGFKRLNGTSQGSRFDVPPKTWIEEELIAFGARSKFFTQKWLSCPKLTRCQGLMALRAYRISKERYTLHSDKNDGLKWIRIALML